MKKKISYSHYNWWEKSEEMSNLLLLYLDWDSNPQFCHPGMKSLLYGHEGWWRWEILRLERELNPYLALLDSVLIITSPRLPDVTSTCLCGSLPEEVSVVHYKTLISLTLLATISLHINQCFLLAFCSFLCFSWRFRRPIKDKGKNPFMCMHSLRVTFAVCKYVIFRDQTGWPNE